MSDQTNGTTPSKAAFRGRFWDRRLRRASFISPSTGERSRRVFTLRDASQRPHEDDEVTGGTAANERSPLLCRDDHGEPVTIPSRLTAVRDYCQDYVLKSWKFATSKTGLGILKCSLAYLIASLATLVPAIASLIGHQQDSKHMVCTVTVWFGKFERAESSFFSHSSHIAS